MDLNLNSKVIRRHDLVAVDMDGELVMMDIESGKYYKLSPVAATIWNLLKVERTGREVINELLKKYEVSDELCEKQTMSFLKKLLEKNVIILRS